MKLKLLITGAQKSKRAVLRELESLKIGAKVHHFKVVLKWRETSGTGIE